MTQPGAARRFEGTPERDGAKQHDAEIRLCKLLVVEDDPVLIGIYQAVFETGYDLLIASTCECALRHVRTTAELDLMILDYRLPDGCGLDVLRQMKQTRPSVPVIVTTGYGDEDIAAESLRCGARDYIKKPFAIDELQKRVEFCLSLKSRGENDRERLLLDEALPVPGFRQGSAASSDIYKIQKAQRFMESKYASNISRFMVADHANLSERQFTRLFKQVTGRTYQECLTNVRIKKAKELLGKDCKMRIVDVANSVGYADLTHFERAFKEAAGVTPSQFRTMVAGQKMAQ
jgi:YesN/AraC family two-component response regulator